MNYSPAFKVPRRGWHTATVLTVVFGGLSILFSGLSLIGIVIVFGAIVPTGLAVAAGLVEHRAWRAILSGGAAFFFFSYSFVAFWVGVVWTILLVGLLLVAASFFALAATVTALVEMVKAINGDNPSSNATRLQSAYQGAPAPIVIHNHNNAQIGNNDNRRLAIQTIDARGARIGVIDRGHSLPDVAASPGMPLLIGRDSNASVVLSDPKASRRHVEILLEGTTWVVRDLGAMNPTRILASNGSEQAMGHTTRRLEHGQLAVGDSVITLYPVGR